MIPFATPMWATGGACPVQATADTTDANYSATSLILDATGKANGTGYTTENSPFASTVTYGGAATVSSEKFEFNGTTAFLSLADAAKWTPSTAFTWEIFGLVCDNAWSGGDQVIVSHYNATSNQRSWFISVSANNVYIATYADGTSGTFISVGVGAGEIQNGVAYDVAITWDGSFIRTYLNGAFRNKVAKSSVFKDSSSLLYAGRHSGGSYFDGRFTAIRLTKDVARYTHESGCGYRPKMPLPISA